jgi:hypothetical protein
MHTYVELRRDVPRRNNKEPANKHAAIELHSDSPLAERHQAVRDDPG